MAELPFETRTLEQLTPLTSLSPDALTAVQEPGGPVGRVSIKQLLGRLVQTDTAKETRADLLADLDHDEPAVALVFADPDPASNGWYRKTGDSGAGTWTQFEKLSAFAAAEIAEYVTQASDSADIATSAADVAQALVNFRATRAEAVADFPVDTYFASAETGELRIYKRIAGAPFYADQGDATAPLTKEVLGNADKGAQLVGFRMPITEALARMAAGKMAERVSIFDFLEFAKHGQILDRVNNDDLSTYLNEKIFQNPECRGARVFSPPGLYNFEAPLILDQHMTLYGAAGREMMDNSADAGGDTGSRFRYRGNSGHLLTLTVPDEDNCRTIPVLRDMLLQHNRLLDNEAENPDRVDGCTLYCAGGLGPTQGDRQLRYILDNVALYGGIDHNMLEEGNTYGSEIRYLHSMRAGLNGMRAVNGPLGGERRIGMVRLFQNGWDGTTEMDRAGGVISSGAVEIDKISASESKGPGLILGGVVNIGTLQLESNGLAYTEAVNDADPLFVGNRKQIVLGWQDNGIASLNVQSCIIDAGPAYRGARIFHSRYASNVRIKGLITNTLGAGGRCVETQAPIIVGLDTFACGLIDVTELNATVFVDNSQRYCIKSGIEVRLRHEAHVALTGNDEQVAFQPDELYNPKGVWGAHRLTAPHNLILDGALLLSMVGMDKANHDRMRIYIYLNGADHRTLPIDPSSFTRAGTNLAAISLQLPTIPMDQGDYVEFKYDVAGGGSTVGLVAKESYLQLTALPK